MRSFTDSQAHDDHPCALGFRHRCGEIATALLGCRKGRQIHRGLQNPSTGPLSRGQDSCGVAAFFIWPWIGSGSGQGRGVLLPALFNGPIHGHVGLTAGAGLGGSQDMPLGAVVRQQNLVMRKTSIRYLGHAL